MSNFHWKILSLLLLSCVLGSAGLASPADWQVKDAPYRAKVKLVAPPNDPEAGVSIELPDFGAERYDLGDAQLVDAAGRGVPIFRVWHGVGQKALFVAKNLDASQDYHLYFGGRSTMGFKTWTPKIGLLLETRSLGPQPKIDSWNDMQETWQRAIGTNGMGFVPLIFVSGNPFGESANYASHYSGWILTPNGGSLVLYTLSSDASFVLADDRPVLQWPGVHSYIANEKNVVKATVPCSQKLTKIDYYQAKISSGDSSSMLGWVKDGHYEAIPEDQWLHSGKSEVSDLEDQSGSPVPIPKIQCKSYMGFGGKWLYDFTFEVPDGVSDDWKTEWHFSDGAVIEGPRCERVMVGNKPQMGTLFLRDDTSNKLIRGVFQITFPDNVTQASINNQDDLSNYLSLIGSEYAAALSKETLESFLPFLFEYAGNDVTGKFAASWLDKNPPPADPLCLPALMSSILMTAQSNPKAALAKLRGSNPAIRQLHARELSLLELDLLVFYLRDPLAVSAAHGMAFDFRNTDVGEIANIRIGDFYRVTGHPEQSIQQYQSIQKTLADETGGRKLPAMDRAYSITVDNLLAQGYLKEADAKLREWEVAHPMAKMDSDFLLLEARRLISSGYFSQALTELDSFKAMHRDSPYEIDADFFRAKALSGLGKTDEARTIWNSIVTNYPNNQLADQCKELLAKP